MLKKTTTARLETNDGLFVGDALIVRLSVMPEVLVWGDRVFRWYSGHTYRECSCLTVDGDEANAKGSMNWNFTGGGAWYAGSIARPLYTYRIAVCDDGTFDVSESDMQLCVRRRWPACFQSLEAAKYWCRGNDEDLIDCAVPEVKK